MKKFVFTALATFFISGCAIKVPYFDDLKPEEVCGGFSKWCQPTGSLHWAKVEPAKEYHNDVSRILGRKFTNVFQTAPCVETKPTMNDVDVDGRQVLQGSIKSESKNEFKSKVDADIVKLVEANIGTQLESLSLDLKAEVSAVTQSNLTQEIDLEYKRIHLNDAYIDAHLDQCLVKLESDENVATGIGVITVEGNWSKKNLTDILAKIESNAGYSTLSAEAKTEYQRGKDRILNGSFEPITYFFVMTYRPGN